MSNSNLCGRFSAEIHFYFLRTRTKINIEVSEDISVDVQFD